MKIEWRKKKEENNRKYKVKVQHPIKRQKHMEEGFFLENCTLQNNDCQQQQQQQRHQQSTRFIH